MLSGRFTQQKMVVKHVYSYGVDTGFRVSFNSVFSKFKESILELIMYF